MSEARIIRVQQASLNFALRPKRLRHDLDRILSRNTLVTGFTESGSFHRPLSMKANEYGYRLIHPVNPRTGKRVTTALAVKRGEARVVDCGWKELVAGRPGLARFGGHAARGYTWAELDVHGELITVFEWHALTGWNRLGRQTQRGRDILHMWESVLKAARNAAKGRRLAIVMGDVNYDPRDPSPNTPSQLLAKYGFTSVFSETARPNRGTTSKAPRGRQIDQIYTFDKDRRVSVDQVVVYSDQRAFTWTDHAQVLARLRIEPLRS